MGRISKLVIKESESELKKLLNKQSIFKNSQRIQSLLYIKQNVFKTRKEMSSHMGVTRRSIEVWLAKYRSGGISEMLISGTRNRKSTCISPEIDKILSEIVNDCDRGFSSYVEAQNWLFTEYGLELKYNTVREHLIRRYGTKIKSPRKSHVKKDNEAVDAFLKTA